MAFQPTRRAHGWSLTLEEQRERIEQLLARNPSLRSTLDLVVQEAYRWARRRASVQSGLRRDAFPADCPWPVAQMLDLNFLP